MAADERTPLIADAAPTEPTKSNKSWLFSAANRVLFAAFFISLSFSITQVSIVYAFRYMECDEFYRTHAPFQGPGDRCNREEVNAGMATQLSIVGMSTTFCGTLNLFVSTWQVKKWGPRAALCIQTFVPGIRVLAQILGLIAGGRAGIVIIQATQLITILGGPAGYILVTNTIAGEVVEPSKRTTLFGQLQGWTMLGVSIGLAFGGHLGDQFGVQRPFETAFFFFMVSSLYAALAMPYISPESLNEKKDGPKGIAGFFAPLRILAPQGIRYGNGRMGKHWGIFFLCCGEFLGVLATGYVATLLQMYATAEFNFSQADNGWLMSLNSLARAFFLIVIFPRIINTGRKWYASSAAAKTQKLSSDQPEILPTDPGSIEAPTATQGEEEPVVSKPTEDKSAYAFDLFFLRWSLVVDGVLTAAAAFATRDWHIYLAAGLIPLASGSAPAAKGIITSMCPSSQRADALNAITLVENIARLATLGLFGFVFAVLAEVRQEYLTFFFNGAIAFAAMAILLLSNFPPTDSVLVDAEEERALLEESAANGGHDETSSSSG